jgi:uncharacterized LabA/DUF88 family protein
MRLEPPVKRTVAFIDGQNLFHAAREAFGYTYPNYDVLELARAVSARKGWQLQEVRFYTGIPEAVDNPFWHAFWAAKLLAMSRAGVRVYSRPLRYRNRVVEVPGFGQHTFLAGDEKGIDVRIALDVIRMAHHRELDVALLFSQDQDFSELAREIRQISLEQDRWIKLACAFPSSPTSRNVRGVEGSDWVPVDRITYDACIDRHDYRSGSG